MEDVEPGDRLTVRGEPRVIRHAGRPGTPPWVELRVDRAELVRRRMASAEGKARPATRNPVVTPDRLTHR